MTTPARVAGISVFLPSHNEAGNVERVVAGFVGALPKFADDYQIIVVNDGSRDRTREIAEQIAATNPHVNVVNHEVNRGYGGAVISGIRASRLAYTLLADGDGQFDPDDVGKLVAKVPEFDVVCGRRVRRADHLMRRINGRAWTMLVRLVLGIGISDIDCGFKLIKRELVEGMELHAMGAMISTELMARLYGRGARVCEVDVTHLPRVTGEQSGANLKVIVKAFRELFALYRELNAERIRSRQ